MISPENRLPANDSHEMSCLLVFFLLKKQHNLKLSSALKFSLRFMC